jgi:hypothetical protein
MITRTFVIAAAIAAAAVAAVATQQQNQYLGRWNLQGTGENSTYVYWLEVKDEGGQLTGMFLNRGGSPVKLGTVKIDNGELVFALPPGRNNAPSPEYHAKLQGEKLVGSVQLANRKVDFVGTRPPKWPPADANASHTFGKPVDLFDGKSMDAWDVQTISSPSRNSRTSRFTRSTN